MFHLDNFLSWKLQNLCLLVVFSLKYVHYPYQSSFIAIKEDLLSINKLTIVVEDLEDIEEGAVIYLSLLLLAYYQDSNPHHCFDLTSLVR